jgi:hypothetical protein
MTPLPTVGDEAAQRLVDLRHFTLPVAESSAKNSPFCCGT